MPTKFRDNVTLGTTEIDIWSEGAEVFAEVYDRLGGPVRLFAVPDSKRSPVLTPASAAAIARAVRDVLLPLTLADDPHARGWQAVFKEYGLRE